MRSPRSSHTWGKDTQYVCNLRIWSTAKHVTKEMETLKTNNEGRITHIQLLGGVCPDNILPTRVGSTLRQHHWLHLTRERGLPTSTAVLPWVIICTSLLGLGVPSNRPFPTALEVIVQNIIRVALCGDVCHTLGCG